VGGALPGAGAEGRDLPDRGGGGTDDQHPHAEDEIYVVRAGRARLVAGDASVAVGPGSVVFVPAGEVHRFVDVSEELEVLVVFAPAESGG
jgi:mannose-6-phosphate isomerase-like protein (cupin superfamily)